MRCISAGSSRASGRAEAESSREREQSGTCGAKAEDMDHQTLLCAHYSLQKARTLPRSHADIKNDEADFSFFLVFFSQRNFFLAEMDVLGRVSNADPDRLKHFVSLKSLCSV